jgi:ribonuclease Z
MPAEGLALHTLHPKWPLDATLTAFPTVHRVPSQGYRLHVGRMRRLYTDKASAMGIPRHLWHMLQSGKSVRVGEREIHPASVCGPERPGLTAVFTGDTAPCEGIITAAKDVDLLIMDATYALDKYEDKAALYGHSTFAQAAQTAKSAGAKRLWLTHYSAMITDPQEHLPAAQAIFPAAECGADGLSRTFTFREGEM